MRYRISEASLAFRCLSKSCHRGLSAAQPRLIEPDLYANITPGFDNVLHRPHILRSVAQENSAELGKLGAQLVVMLKLTLPEVSRLLVVPRKKTPLKRGFFLQRVNRQCLTVRRRSRPSPNRPKAISAIVPGSGTRTNAARISPPGKPPDAVDV
jgi:hypothetical protein